jgi:hypothetical protein
VNEPSEKQSLVGAMVYPRPGSRLAKGQFGWPFANMVVTDDQLILGPRLRLARLVRPVTLRFDEIERIERQV